jgi:sarcosine oxidase subunit gamma
MSGNALRLSPLHDAYRGEVADWAVVNGMRLPRVFGKLAEPVTLSDVSALARCGCKGPGAAEWLGAQGLPVPSEFNTWSATPHGLVARLAATEFFIEDSRAETIATLKRDLGKGTRTASGPCYPVLREDAALVLAGPRANEILLQTCNIDFAALDLSKQPLVMTSMVGVSVLVIPRPCLKAGVAYRIWCDPTLGAYLWRTLLAIAREQGGDATAFDFSL